MYSRHSPRATILLTVGFLVLAVVRSSLPAHAEASTNPAVAAGGVLPRLRPTVSGTAAQPRLGVTSTEHPGEPPSEIAAANLEIRMDGETAFRQPVYQHLRRRAGMVQLRGTADTGLQITTELRQVRPNLLRFSVELKARAQTTVALRWSLTPVSPGEFASFSKPETNAVTYNTFGGGPEYGDIRGQTFPVAMVRSGGLVTGLIADSPGRWANRCLLEINPGERRLAVMSGDGRPAEELRIRYDARDTYRYDYDGWQRLAPGETRRFDTWIFRDAATNHYQAQLAAHLAMANAKGWNRSAVEAILRNTAHFLLRENLMRQGKGEGKYIFTSGIGYGWKQWVSDGFWQAVGLDDPELLAESHRSVFINRITYEDNAQYFLVWACLARRAGHQPNLALATQAYEFMRRHETNGIFYPPGGLNPQRPKGFKTYHDLLEYEDDDAPVSNQGFHCAALLAARELGFKVTRADIQRSIDAYQSMFLPGPGYFPTSIKQPENIGQDVFYGAALAYAVFGAKLLPDSAVATHWRTSQRIATPYGLRVISRADGSLLPGHSGSYVFGGSWFLNDAANHLMAGLHGIPHAEADAALLRRLEAELVHVPAFNESISTVTGKPHGHILYSWNTGYWWLRREFRKRQGLRGPDAVEREMDRKLGVVSGRHGLSLAPAPAP